MNICAVIIIFPMIQMFKELLIILRPEYGIDNPLAINVSLFSVLIMIGAIIITILLHELLHGLFFWVFTRDMPEFAFKSLYAYAAAPEWYIPKHYFIVIGLAPLLVITAIIILLLSFASPSWIQYITAAGVFNAAGSLGDIIVIAWILFQPSGSLVRDTGDTFSLYHKNKEKINKGSR